MNVLITPKQFLGDTPPSRIFGLECEYKIQGGGEYLYIAERAKRAAGYRFCYSFLDNGGKLYYDVEHLEYATPESLGPKQAAAADMAGIMVMQKIVTASKIPHNGLYRMTGSYISKNGSSKGDTNGYHENYMFPLELAQDNLLDVLVPAFLGSDVQSGSGTLRDKGYVFSQKVWGIGETPIERHLSRSTTHGKKPMAVIRVSDDDTVGKNDWVRMEVRFADAGLNADMRFRRLGAMSLVLRMVEHADLIGRERLSKLAVKNPVMAAQLFAADLSLNETVLMDDGRHMRATDIQEALAEIALELKGKIALPDDEPLAAEMWYEGNEKFKACSPDKAEYGSLVREADIAAKHLSISRGIDPSELNNKNERAMAEVLLWDRILPEGKGLAWWKHFTGKVVTTDDVEAMNKQVPPTRASRRARLLKNRRMIVKGMNWSAATIAYKGRIDKTIPVSMTDPYRHED